MGYYMEQFDQDFKILAANKPAAFALLKQWEQKEIARNPSLRKALHSVSAESYSAAAQASLRLLNAQDRKLFYRQWADPIEEIYGTKIYGDVLYRRKIAR